ncbi:hypothetical protein JTE90_013240 [Oedothorax gibbosus]|uniref:Uncharacterized protein n=1 Tax=Oedothorax gibbosus TaxID=931172 RepID=A0AAV6VEJ5_9ARAC|nr:hypothetical protein JTE90_013240 [Oedothorax gibbosus]
MRTFHLLHLGNWHCPRALLGCSVCPPSLEKPRQEGPLRKKILTGHGPPRDIKVGMDYLKIVRRERC